jgi:cytochrome c553
MKTAARIAWVMAFASSTAMAQAPSQTPGQTPPQIAACQACHGRAGVSDQGHIPNLAGQKPGYLVAQLQAFKSGARKNELMAAIAAQLSDTEMRGLAQFWAAQGGAWATAEASTAMPILSRMTLPAGFPEGFTVYETVVSTSDAVVTERHANKVALQAARAGQPLPDGSVIVVANHALVQDKNGQATKGAVSSYAAMASRDGWGAAVPALLRNGNWDYALFDGQGVRNERLNQAPCLACHRPIASSSYVFTLKALREQALR